MRNASVCRYVFTFAVLGVSCVAGDAPLAQGLAMLRSSHS